MIYIILLIVLLIGTYKYDLNKQVKGKETYFAFSCFMLCVVSAIKYRVGSDIPVYMEEYEYVPELNNISINYLFNTFNRQFGWQFFMSFCKTVTNSFLLPQALVAIFVNYAIFRFIKRYSVNIFLGLLLYFLLIYIQFNFETLRQSVSIAFFIVSIKYYRDNNWKLFFLLIFLAYSFHASAVILFVLPIIKLVKIDKVNKYWFVAIGIVCIIFLPQITNRLPQLFYMLEGDSNVHHFDVMESLNISFLGNILQFLIYFFISAILNNKDYNDRGWYFPFLYLYFICFLCSWGLPFFARISHYFIIFFVLSCADSLSNIKSVHFFHVIFIIFILYTSERRYTTDWYGIPSYYKYYPYHTYFDQEREPLRELRIESLNRQMY